MDEIDIVGAGENDIAPLLELSNWAALHTPANFATEPEPLAAWLQSWRETKEMYPWLVAKADGRVLGFAKASPHRSRCAYNWTAEVTVYVHPDTHRRGIGRRLYARLIPLLRAQGYVTLLAGITPPNPGSEGLHAAFGFIRCGTFHRSGWKFGQWHDVGYWELQLQPDGAPPRPLKSVREVI
jgi:phosphinothricin acetyltransferase